MFHLARAFTQTYSNGNIILKHVFIVILKKNNQISCIECIEHVKKTVLCIVRESFEAPTFVPHVKAMRLKTSANQLLYDCFLIVMILAARMILESTMVSQLI